MHFGKKIKARSFLSSKIRDEFIDLWKWKWIIQSLFDKCFPMIEMWSNYLICNIETDEKPFLYFAKLKFRLLNIYDTIGLKHNDQMTYEF